MVECCSRRRLTMTPYYDPVFVEMVMNKILSDLNLFEEEVVKAEEEEKRRLEEEKKKKQEEEEHKRLSALIIQEDKGQASSS
ncbi:hypothetical protein A2U01_0078070, partial [Trifolium medium]|nr:hypothetical protein [Trifolium medium]